MRYTLHMLVATAIALTLAVAQPAAATQKKGQSASAHSMTGCLAKGTEANTYVLNNTESKGPKTVEIVGAASGVDLAAHVGHKVTITGSTVGEKAAAKAEAKAAGKKETKKDVKEEAGEHHMHVTGLKMVSTSCS
jgi:trans-2-enoyl-CoA reductase